MSRGKFSDVAARTCNGSDYIQSVALLGNKFDDSDHIDLRFWMTSISA